MDGRVTGRWRRDPQFPDSRAPAECPPHALVHNILTASRCLGVRSEDGLSRRARIQARYPATEQITHKGHDLGQAIFRETAQEKSARTLSTRLCVRLSRSFSRHPRRRRRADKTHTTKDARNHGSQKRASHHTHTHPSPLLNPAMSCCPAAPTTLPLRTQSSCIWAWVAQLPSLWNGWLSARTERVKSPASLNASRRNETNPSSAGRLHTIPACTAIVSILDAQSTTLQDG